MQLAPALPSSGVVQRPRLGSQPIAGALVFAGVLLASLAVFFRHAVLTGLETLYGDADDGLIEIAILEHWFRVFAHGERLTLTGWFHPFPATLGYNDTYLLPGLFYTLARLTGADPFIAAFCSHIAMKAVGFTGMHVLLARGLGARPAAALFGAALLATANATLLHMNHAQLLSVALLPWLGWTAKEAAGALLADRRAALHRYGVAFALLFGLTALNAFYVAWFFAFFSLLFAVCWFRLAGRNRRAALLAIAWRRRASLLVVAAAIIAASAPFLLLYLPKVTQGARHGWAEGAGHYTPDIAAFFNVGEGNLIWGQSLRALTEAATGRPPRSGEMQVGLPLGMFAAVVTALVWAWRRRTEQPVTAALGVALALLAFLVLRWPNGFSYWYLVYHLLPGADAVRTVSRLLIFALVPVIALIVIHLDRTIRSPAAALLIGGFLLLEQVQLEPPLMLDLEPQRRMLAISPPPVSCRTFFVVSARPAAELAAAGGDAYDAAVRDRYRHNVDAMLLASHHGRPTVNGMSTFNPPGWNFARPDGPDYLSRIRRYAVLHGIEGLCGLDRRRDPQWFTLDQDRAARAG